MSRNSGIPADVQDAFYRVCHDFGVQRLAGLMGTPPGVLYNKANPNESSHHKATLADAILVTVLSGDRRIAHAFARTVGGVFLDLPTADFSQTSDAALLDLALAHDREDGDLAAALSQALADGSISRADWEVLRREGYEAVAAVMELLARLEGMAR